MANEPTTITTPIITSAQLRTALTRVKEYVDDEIGVIGDDIDSKISGKADKTAVNTLIGSDTGKSVRAISAEEVAKIVAGADQSYDTLKEIADWILSDTTGAAKMSNDITRLDAILDGIGGADEETTVVAYVTKMINALGIGDYVKTATMTTELGKKVDKVDGSRLMTSAEGTKLAGIAEGAQENSIQTIQVNGELVQPDINKSISLRIPEVTCAEDNDVTTMLKSVFGNRAPSE